MTGPAGREQDNVQRRRVFERQHPDVTITHETAPSWHWAATWTGPDGTPREAVDTELGGLLDQLGQLDPP